jgi:hypothetical protein
VDAPCRQSSARRVRLDRVHERAPLCERARHRSATRADFQHAHPVMQIERPQNVPALTRDVGRGRPLRRQLDELVAHVGEVPGREQSPARRALAAVLPDLLDLAQQEAAVRARGGALAELPRDIVSG